ncbi:MAG: hypothetical protein HC865_03465 [Cyanobacteria bacterium RU_5_0]|nr:hypothetical protein [Cyanobacteria bacterium RU_5_0]
MLTKGMRQPANKSLEPTAERLLVRTINHLRRLNLVVMPQVLGGDGS